MQPVCGDPIAGSGGRHAVWRRCGSTQAIRVLASLLPVTGHTDILRGAGLWLVQVSTTRDRVVQEYLLHSMIVLSTDQFGWESCTDLTLIEVAIHWTRYNGWVSDWKTEYEKEFSRASFVLEMGLALPNASTHIYALTADLGSEDMNMIPPGYYPDLDSYKPLQYVSDDIKAYEVVQSSNKVPPLPRGREAEATINVTMVATTVADSRSPSKNTTVQRLTVGQFQMIGEWPAPPHACDVLGRGDDSEARTVNGVCEVLRAVRSLCLVVSWRGSEERWAWRPSGKGCYADDREHGYGDWVLAMSAQGSDDQLSALRQGNFLFGAGVFEEHDPFLMIQGDMLDTLMSSPGLEADACLICGSILVTIFVVHWTVCEKMDDGELDRELTRILIATGAASAPPDRATADRIFRRRREAERRRAEARAAAAAARVQAQAQGNELQGEDRPEDRARAGRTVDEQLVRQRIGAAADDDDDVSVQRIAVVPHGGGGDGIAGLDDSVAWPSAADGAAVRRTTLDDR